MNARYGAVRPRQPAAARPVPKLLWADLFIHTSDYLRYIRRKHTVTALPTTPQKCRRTTLLNAQVFHLSFFHVYRVPVRDTDELRKHLVVT